MSDRATSHTMPPALAAIARSSATLSFTSRPIPLHAEYRPIWRVPLLALMLKICCRGAVASPKRLHILNWAVRTPSAGRELLAVIHGQRRPGDVIVRLEPTLNLVIDLARGEGVVEFPQGDRVQLTSTGVRLADEIVKDVESLRRERELLQRVGKGLSEKLVDHIIQVGARGPA